MASEEEGRSGLRAHAGELYGDVLAALLTQETTRKASIEQRGITVITTSGGLVSLLVALSALLLGRNSTAPLGGGSRGLLIAAVVIFIVAAGLGLAANMPRSYVGFSNEDLDRIINEHSWSGNKEEAALLIAEHRVKELKTAVKINNGKADYIQWAITAQVIAVGLVAAAIVLMLI